MLVVANLAVIGVILVSYRLQAIPMSVVIPIGVCIVGMLALFTTRGPRARATTLVVGLALTAGALFALNGPTAAGFIALFTACVLSVLLLGTAAGGWAVVSATALIIAGATENGLVPHRSVPADLDGGMQAWLQLGLVWLACTSSVVFSVAWLTHQFSRALVQKQTALDEAQQANHARAESDHRRVDTENALIEAQRHETLGRMVGGVSHDFNNAMFVILGWNDLLRRGEASPEQVAQAHTAIATAARNASVLAKRMVTMSREESGSQVSASLESVAREAIGLLERLLPEHIRLESHLVPVPAVAMDPMRLQQLIFDLALAARDRMPEGGRIRLEVAPEASPEGGRTALLSLHYEARTARPDALTVIADTPPAVVRALLDRVGGTLAHRSTRNGAQVFEVRLPTLQPATEDAIAVANPNERRSLQILLVEDDPAVRQIMTMALRQKGHRVREAADGDEALRMVEEDGERDDLLCMDAIIPGTPSAEVIACFRRRRPGAPVLVCSGHVASEALARLIRDEHLPFLPKPFSPEALVRRIEQLTQPRPEPVIEAKLSLR
jgi:signal transduction histidine kinase/CheY-like chemotaxis protein